MNAYVIALIQILTGPLQYAHKETGEDGAFGEFHARQTPTIMDLCYFT